MKTILINGYYFSRPFTGFGVYTVGLLKALSETVDPQEYRLIVITPVKPEKSLGKNITIVVRTEKKTAPGLSKLFWEQFEVLKVAQEYKADLIHHYYPSTIVWDHGIKQLTSIHDATPWHFAEHNSSLKVRLFRKFTVWSNRRADRFISVSQFGRFDVSTVFKIPKEKIDVVYNGIDDRFRVTVTKSGKEAVREKYSIPNPYIFYIGGFEVHKNVRRLFLSYARAASEIKQDLVIAGGVFSKTRKDVYRDFFDLPDLIKNYKLEKRVHLIGIVPDEDLPALYQAADLFVMPSLAEGFNLPLVQAFASKVPAISANSPASQEISQGAALMVNALNTEAMAAAIVKLLHNEKHRNELVAKGLDRQDQFHWSDAASRLLAIYGEMTNN